MSTNTELPFNHSPYVPYDMSMNAVYEGYISAPWAPGGGLQPFEYTSWRDEMMSWHENCYLHAGLNPCPTYVIRGRDAVRFLTENLVNTMNNFPVGKGKHGIMVNEDGLLTGDGMVLRTGEDEFVLYWAVPFLVPFLAEQGGYDLTCDDISTDAFVYQLGGPRALEILETATGESLRDIKFIHHRMSSIAGKSVRILRVGMAGSLGYEVHGAVEDCLEVYKTIHEAGKPYGIRRLGRHAYWNTHTENGFPQLNLHFPGAPVEGFAEYLEARGLGYFLSGYVALNGSAGQDLGKLYVNPVEIGWGGMINFDHDFVGKEALQKIKAEKASKMVTLVWNTDDIVDVYRSEFEPGEHYAVIEGPEDFPLSGQFGYVTDAVLKDGKQIGRSTGRIYSYYYRKMLSLCTVHSSLEEGEEVIILWGNPGTRQKEIRATVGRFPYLNEGRNQDVDVSKLPEVAGISQGAFSRAIS